MLSPCIRQVTHALLTRPPLTYTSLGFSISPFDLHVLSTPPAFILSQDQTLNKMVSKRSRAQTNLFRSRSSFKLEIDEALHFTISRQFPEGLHVLLVLRVLSLFNLQGASPFAFRTGR